MSPESNCFLLTIVCLADSRPLRPWIHSASLIRKFRHHFQLKNGNLCKVVLVKLESKKDEKTGRMMMAEVAGSEYTVNAELVLIAAGFLGSEDYVKKAFGVEVNERTNVKTAPGEYKTNVPNIFTAGDKHRGQSLVVWAIREGREAAQQIDLNLMGYTNLSVQ